MVFYSCFTLLMALTVISVNANGLRNEQAGVPPVAVPSLSFGNLSAGDSRYFVC